MNCYTNVRKLYNELYSCEEIIDLYKQVEIFEEKDKGWAYHNFEHVKNVIDILEQILNGLNIDEESIYKAKIAAIFHDVGAVNGKDNHAYRSYVYAKEFFKRNDIIFDDMDLVLDAIKIHSDGFETTNILALALILADKLDIKRTRISEEGKKIIGNRQYSHIEDIIIKIDNSILTINFITDGNINLKELNEYYFTKKVFSAIEKFAIKFNLKTLLLLDNKKWDL